MTIERNARLTVGVNGVDQAVRGAKQVDSAWTQVGKNLIQIKSPIAEVAANFRRLVTDISDAATGMKAIDWNGSKERAKAFEEQVTRMAVRSGQDMVLLKKSVAETAESIGVVPERVIAAADSFERLTYDGQGAVDAVAALGAEANRTGRQLEELAPLGVVMKNAFGGTELEGGIKR